jgi:hypothetical protein
LNKVIKIIIGIFKREKGLIKNKERLEVLDLYYSPNICRSSGNICGWFSRKFRNGVLKYGLFFGIDISSGYDQSLS